MDATFFLKQLFGTLADIFWWLPLLLMLLAFLNSSLMKGIFGEFQVNLAAKLRLDKKNIPCSRT